MIAVLYARGDSVYKSLPGCDVYDIERDARTFPGGCPVVAHPPCRAWGRLRRFARPRKGERALAIHSIRMVRQYGGVLEHPASSTLWKRAGLPAPGKRDRFGGWSIGVNQSWWGHKAEKSTLLYICGVDPRSIPQIPYSLHEPTHVVESSTQKRRPAITKAEREATPLLFAAWLIDLAARCKGVSHG